MKKIPAFTADTPSIQWAGKFLADHYDWIIQTGMTAGWEHSDFEIITSGNSTYDVEVKRVKYETAYRSQSLKISDEIYGDGKIFFLNKENITGGTLNAKFQTLIANKNSILVVLQPNSVTIFTNKMLKEAYKGDCIMLQRASKLAPHHFYYRHEERKAVIDLNKGKKINVKVPWEFFAYGNNNRVAFNN